MRPPTARAGRRGAGGRVAAPAGRASRTLSRSQVRGLAAAGAVVAASGLAMIALRYLFGRDDPFLAWPHPAWPAVVAVHVFAAPVLIFFVGSTWATHVTRLWTGRRRRASGVVLMGALGAAALSGYLLYFIGDEDRLHVARIVHAAVGAMVVAAGLSHVVRGRARRRRARDRGFARRAETITLRGAPDCGNRGGGAPAPDPDPREDHGSLLLHGERLPRARRRGRTPRARAQDGHRQADRRGRRAR